MSFLSRVSALVKKELKEYLLKPGSISWGVVFPLVFTFSFIIRLGDVDHIAPGMVGISSLFATTSFLASSVIFERRLRTFERLLLAPIRFGEIVLGKIIVGTMFGTMVSLITLSVLLQFMVYSVWNWGLTVAAIILTNVMFSALGLYISLKVENPINVMTWLNLLRLPMIFTSSALVSFGLFPKWFLIVGILTPMTYSVESLRYGLLHYTDVMSPELAFLMLSILGMTFILLSIRAIKNLY